MTFTGVINTETNRHVLKLLVIPYILIETFNLPSPEHVRLSDMG